MNEGLNASRLTLDFFVIIIGGLLASYILTVSLSAGIYDVVVEHDHVQEWELPPHDQAMLSEGRVIGLVKEYDLGGRLVLLLLGANLLRLIHSFFIMSRSKEYSLLFVQEGLLSKYQRRWLIGSQLTGQILIVSVGFWSLLWLDAEDVWLGGMALLVGLLIYDWSSESALRTVPDNLRKQFGSLDAEEQAKKRGAAEAVVRPYMDLAETFHKWLGIDVVALTLGIAFFILLEMWEGAETVVAYLVAGILLLVVLLDYIIVNPHFYWREILVPRGVSDLYEEPSTVERS